MLKNDLTNAEMLVMKCIWDTPHDMVLSEIVAMVNERYDKGWKPQTASTFLARLVQKKFLRMDRDGRIYTYHPLVTDKEFKNKVMNQFISFWEGGSPKEFLSAYYDYHGADKEELDELRELIDGLDK